MWKYVIFVRFSPSKKEIITIQFLINKMRRNFERKAEPPLYKFGNFFSQLSNLVCLSAALIAYCYVKTILD